MSNKTIMFSDEQVALLEEMGYLGDDGVFTRVADGVYELEDWNDTPTDEALAEWELTAMGQAAVGHGCETCKRTYCMDIVANLPHGTLTDRINDAEKLMRWMERGSC